MKNFALLLSSLAVASTAFAVSPDAGKELPKASKATVQPVKVSATSKLTGKVLSEKNLVKEANVRFNTMQKAPGLSVSYDEPAGIFALGLTDQLSGFNGFSYRKGPAYTPLKWTNTSVGATEFEWEMYDYSVGADQTYNTFDLERSESYSIIKAPILYGLDAEGGSGVFQYGAEAVSDTELSAPVVEYFFGGGCSPDFETDFGMSTYMYGYNKADYTTFGFMEYNPDEPQYFNPATGLDYILTDSEEDGGYGMTDPKFEGFANFFGQPAAPYLITKMWSWLNIQAKRATNIEMTLYKIDEDGLVTDEVIAAGEAGVNRSSKPQSLVVTFELYALDEDGLQTDEPIVIDCPFLAVMTVNKDDIEMMTSVCGGGAVAPANSAISYPRHAYLAISNDEDVSYIASPYRYYTDDTRSELMTVSDFMWMVDAVFPWSYTLDGINEAQVAKEGGVASFNISSYIGIQYFNYYLPEDCDWIDMTTATVTTNEELVCQVLNLPVAALPEGVEGRTAVIEVEGIGTELTLIVNQGEGNAVSAIVVDKNAQYFDLQGRRVANPDKGIYIKKTANKTEKVIL